MDNVKLRTIMTTQGTRRTRGGQRGPEGARGGGGRDNIIPRILSHQRGSWGWWGERRLVHESRCTKPPNFYLILPGYHNEDKVI